MASLVKQYTFSAGTASSAQVNQDFDDIIAFINNQVVHRDGSKDMTAPLALPAEDPTNDNQATRKAYVDNHAKDLYVVKASGVTAIANATPTGVATGIEVLKRGAWSLDGNYGIVIPKTGVYEVSGVVTYASLSGVDALLQAFASVNGTVLTQTRGSIILGAVAQVPSVAMATAPCAFTQGDIVHLNGYQNTGSPQNMTVDSFISLAYLGA